VSSAPFTPQRQHAPRRLPPAPALDALCALAHCAQRGLRTAECAQCAQRVVADRSACTAHTARPTAQCTHCPRRALRFGARPGLGAARFAQCDLLCAGAQRVARRLAGCKCLTSLMFSAFCALHAVRSILHTPRIARASIIFDMYLISLTFSRYFGGLGGFGSADATFPRRDASRPTQRAQRPQQRGAPSPGERAALSFRGKGGSDPGG
jgi:hypothetical protein